MQKDHPLINLFCKKGQGYTSTTIITAYKRTCILLDANQIELVKKRRRHLTAGQVNDGEHVTWSNNVDGCVREYHRLRLIKGYVHRTSGRDDNGNLLYSSHVIAKPYNTCVSYEAHKYK